MFNCCHRCLQMSWYGVSTKEQRCEAICLTSHGLWAVRQEQGPSGSHLGPFRVPRNNTGGPYWAFPQTFIPPIDLECGITSLASLWRLGMAPEGRLGQMPFLTACWSWLKASILFVVFSFGDTSKQVLVRNSWLGGGGVELAFGKLVFTPSVGLT